MRRDKAPALCPTRAIRCCTSVYITDTDKNVSIFSQNIPESGPIYSKFMNLRAPIGYIVDQNGVKKRRPTKNGPRTDIVTRAPTMLTAISERVEGHIARLVEITCMNTLEQIGKIEVTTREAFSPRIAKILLDCGCCCTARDGARLAEYFKECYVLRAEEARRGV